MSFNESGADNKGCHTITRDTTVVAAPQRQFSTTLAGEVVILDVEKGGYFGLANVGTLIWTIFQTPRRGDDRI